MQSHRNSTNVEGPVKVRTAASGLRLIIEHEITAHKHSVLSSNGLMDVILGQSLIILVSNFTDASRRLSKHMKIAWAESTPDLFIPLSEAVRTKASVDAFAMVQCDELCLSKR